MMRFDIAHGDTLVLDGGRIRIMLEKKSGSRARLRIQADDSIVISMEAEAQKNFRRPISA